MKSLVLLGAVWTSESQRAEAPCCPLAMGGHVTARGWIWKEMSQTVDVWGAGSMVVGT